MYGGTWREQLREMTDVVNGPFAGMGVAGVVEGALEAATARNLFFRFDQHVNEFEFSGRPPGTLMLFVGDLQELSVGRFQLDMGFNYDPRGAFDEWTIPRGKVRGTADFAELPELLPCDG